MSLKFLPFISALSFVFFIHNVGIASESQSSKWIESDSLTAIKTRTLNDFSLTYNQALELIQKRYGMDIDSMKMREFADKHYVETRIIDGVELVHRKSVSNLGLLCPRYNNGYKWRGWDASADRIEAVREIVDNSVGNGNLLFDMADAKGTRHVKYRFSIDVPYIPELAGDTLRVWMPVPVESPRQSNVRIISASADDYVLSGLDKSVHNSIYMQAPVVENSTTHFEYVAEYDARGQYFSPQYILRAMKPYDKSSELYKKYTAFETPHIVNLDSMARAIVGDESNPYRQSELIYDFIIKNYPWAGALEYSTIDCIPDYVIREKHGDCGQVSLLYISLMRSLGVPARWESGWMITPGDEGIHDWAEVYFEGVGWVPVDTSFGRFSSSEDKRVVNFYSTGFDKNRFAANKGVCGQLYPAKRFVRSETVDFQFGEVECSKGNLFFPLWKRSLDILDSEN